MWNVNPAKPVFRVLFVFFGIILLGFGLAALKTSLLASSRVFLLLRVYATGLSYRNLWGGLVFGPFAILFGLVFILGALFKPSIFK